MSQSFIQFITAYGYGAVFLLVFLQELGVPNPVANEFVLLFAGSLCFTGALSFPLVFLAAISADIIGTGILYFVFYYFGTAILSKKHWWMPIKRETIERLGERVRTHGQWGIFVGRLLPFVRGYASIAAGVFCIPPRKFFLPVLASALLWSGGYVALGSVFGKYWIGIATTAGGIEKVFMFAVLATIAILVIRSLANRYRTS